MNINSQNYQLIVSDYDGTLAGADFIISDPLKESINKWRQSGKKFTIATARSFKGALENSCDFLELSDPVICNGGAQIIDPKTKQIIYSEYVPSDEVQRIIKHLEKTDFLFEVQNADHAYTSSEELQKLQPHKKYQPLDDLVIDKIFKLRIVTTTANPSVAQEFIDQLKEEFTDLHIIYGPTPYSQGYDITSEKATKHLAVLRLGGLLNIPPEQMIGIGDSLNDYPLLTACGYKVAMSNAPQEILDIADYVTDDYTRNGVANFINKLLES